jgi:lysophospholipase L1-like esterase
MEMYRLFLARFAALVLLAIAYSCALSNPAFAEPTVETFKAPAVEPKGLSSHGDGSITITNNCVNHEWEENVLATLSPTGLILSETPRVEEEWKTEACNGATVSGYDNTVYVAQFLSSSKRRIVAIRNGVKLWTSYFKNPSGYGEDAIVESMVLGQDGNLYAAIYWNYENESHPEIERLVSIDSSTGAVRFVEPLPNHSSIHWGSEFHHVMPYEKGVAILNVKEVFYFNYDGEEESEKRFSAASSGQQIPEIDIAPDTGRIYWVVQSYNSETLKWERSFCYRDPEGSTQEIELSEGKQLIDMEPTPSNGVVVAWYEAKNEANGFSYVDEEGSEVYQETLNNDPAYHLSTSNYAVDDSGNVIVRQKVTNADKSYIDRDIEINSFSPTGIKTQLFNSFALGTEGVQDSFVSSSSMAESISKHHVYIVLCHAEGELIEECNLTKNPTLISISDSSIGTYDYPRSAIFKAGLEKSSYVALGDSYSSGEGVPSFIPPSDEDGCHRSYDAYPAYLVNNLTSNLRLDAFVACSGAETADIDEEFKGEEPQLYSLSSNTEIVTITIGGNDIGFEGFAEECVISTCDSSSPAYEYSMEQIATYLPEKLEKLYGRIHENAENAEVYVVGYPQVISETEPECGLIFAHSEEEASREVVSALDKVIKEKAEAAEGKFIYVNPDAEGSPFIGHELCVAGTESYFNGAEYPEKKYSFHPNQRGQQAYAEVIAAVL